MCQRYLVFIKSAHRLANQRTRSINRKQQAYVDEFQVPIATTNRPCPTHPNIFFNRSRSRTSRACHPYRSQSS